MKLFGEAANPTTYMFHWGAMYNQHQAAAGGIATHLKIYCRDERAGSGSRVAIYDSANVLKEVTIDGLAAGWNTIEISGGPTIVQGNYYYLAWIDCHGGLCTDIAYLASPGTDMLQIRAPFELETLDDFAFPATIPSEWGYTYENCVMAITVYAGLGGVPLIGPGLVGDSPLVRKVA